MRFVYPGSGRLTLTLLAVVPAVMAFPWRTVPERRVLGVAVIAAVLLLGWWSGAHLTSIAGRSLALLWRGRRLDRGQRLTTEPCRNDARTTVVLRVIDSTGDIPLDLIGGYLDRYGVRCDAVRITIRDSISGRTVWIGLTMSAAANLAALQARSPTIPLRQTAELTSRRLADELCERGWTVNGFDLGIPDLLGPGARERWRSITAGASGRVTAYSMAGRPLAETLTAVWAAGYEELWTALELSANGVAAACAIRDGNLPCAAKPVPGLVSQGGTQWAALQALDPTSTKLLGRPAFGAGELSAIRWRAGAVGVEP